MAVTTLTASGLSGIISGSGIVGPFSLGPGASPNNVFSVAVTYKLAVGTVTITKSIDGGQTFSPIKAATLVTSSMSGTDALNVFHGDASSQFRLEYSLTSGSVSYVISATVWAVGAIDRHAIGYPASVYVLMKTFFPFSASQIQSLADNKWTLLSASDLANLTTVYKKGYFLNTNADGSHTRNVALITLSIAAATARAVSRCFHLGETREYRAQAVTVTSVVDGNGNAVSSATSWIDPATIYTAGAVLTCRDLYGSDGARSFTDPLSTRGFYFRPTALEALDGGTLTQTNTDGPNPGMYPPAMPNLTALGL